MGKGVISTPHYDPRRLLAIPRCVVCSGQDKLIVILVKKDEVNWYDLTSTNSR